MGASRPASREPGCITQPFQTLRFPGSSEAGRNSQCSLQDAVCVILLCAVTYLPG